MPTTFVGVYFTADLKPAPAVNFTPFDAAIWTGSPVRGLRPIRALRSVRDQATKPGSVTLSPLATALWTVSINASTAFCAAALLRSAAPATLSTSSDLFTLNLRTSAVIEKLNAFAQQGQAFPPFAQRATPLCTGSETRETRSVP